VSLFGLLLAAIISVSVSASELSGSALRTRIQTVLVASPYRMSRAALSGTIRYQLEEDGAPVGWQWPETGEQHVGREQRTTVLTVCTTCGSEAKPTDAELTRNLAPTPWLESDDRAVKAFARAARGGSVDARMRRLVTAVQQKLSGPVSYEGYHTAKGALQLKGGDCTEYALLLAAAARARGIPTRVVAGLAYGSRFVGRPHSFGPHMWVQAWTGTRWVSYDAGLGAFDSGHLALVTGDGSPESLQGVWEAIGRVRVADAMGLVQ
jgi:transglutaminase-like putative cysteine protease